MGGFGDTRADGAGGTTGGLGPAGAGDPVTGLGVAEVAAGAVGAVYKTSVSSITGLTVGTTAADVRKCAALYPTTAIGCRRRWIEGGRETRKAGR